MVLDTSAIVAVIASEPDAIQYRSAMLGATSLAMSAVAVLESKIVLRSRHGEAAVIVPFGAPMAELAFDAFRRYGRGRDTPPGSTSSIAPSTHWLKCAASPCCLKAATSRRPMFRRRSECAA
jgi:predicted nucleic acid-binding protein